MRKCMHNMILGLPFCKLFKGVKLRYSGKKPTLNLTETAAVDHLALCLAQAKVKTPKLFLGMKDSDLPIKSPSRLYKPEEWTFIESEINKLLSQGIIRKSRSPWKSQLVIVKRTPKWHTRWVGIRTLALFPSSLRVNE